MEVLRPDREGLQRAAALLRAGQVLAFPTDTVYGLGVLARDQDAVERVFVVKGRPRERPLVLMVASPEAASGVALVDDRAREYMDRWWPGPLTLVLPSRDGGPGTVAVRVPDHPVALQLLQIVGLPMATTSANLSGQPPALTAAEAALDGVAAVLDGGDAPGGIPSTLLDLTGSQPRVLRLGPVTFPPAPAGSI